MNPAAPHKASRRFSLFLAVGATATGCQFLITLLLNKGIGISIGPSAAIGYVCGAVVSYLANRNITFTSRKAHLLTAPRFIVMNLIGVSATWALMRGLFALDISIVPAQVITSTIVLGLNYALSALWVFAPGAQDKTSRSRTRTWD